MEAFTEVQEEVKKEMEFMRKNLSNCQEMMPAVLALLMRFFLLSAPPLVATAVSFSVVSFSLHSTTATGYCLEFEVFI